MRSARERKRASPVKEVSCQRVSFGGDGCAHWWVGYFLPNNEVGVPWMMGHSSSRPANMKDVE